MKLNKKQKDTLFKIVIFSTTQLLCFIIFLIISAKLGFYVWTVEMLTSSLTGTIMQILNLAFIINGIILFVYVLIFLILLFKS